MAEEKNEFIDKMVYETALIAVLAQERVDEYTALLAEWTMQRDKATAAAEAVAAQFNVDLAATRAEIAVNRAG